MGGPGGAPSGPLNVLNVAGPCTECGETLAECDEWIRETGHGCCDACFVNDTHGLLRAGPVSEHAQEISNLTRLAAQMVLARHEHASAIRMLINDVGRLIEETALLRGRVAELELREERVDERTKRNLMLEAMHEVRVWVRGLPERVAELEDCVVGLERHLKLRRRPVAQRPKALGPGPVTP